MASDLDRAAAQAVTDRVPLDGDSGNACLPAWFIADHGHAPEALAAIDRADRAEAERLGLSSSSAATVRERHPGIGEG